MWPIDLLCKWKIYLDNAIAGRNSEPSVPDQRQDGVTEPGLPISIVNVDGGEKDGDKDDEKDDEKDDGGKDDEKDDGEKDDEKDDGEKDDEKDDGKKDDGKEDEKDGDKIGESSTVVAGSSAILLATLFSI